MSDKIKLTIDGKTIEVEKGTTGVGATEVPRGLLIHEYTVDDSGAITGANLIIPTNMNHNNIERDLKALVPAIVGKSKEEIQKRTGELHPGT